MASAGAVAFEGIFQTWEAYETIAVIIIIINNAKL